MIVTMQRTRLTAVGKTIFALVLFLAPRPMVSEQREVTVKGNAVAIGFNPAMALVVNGSIHMEFIVRVDAPSDLAAQFIRVRLSVSPQQRENWINSLSSIHQFRLKRRKEDDGLLVQFVPLTDASSGEEVGRFPAWKNLPGYEGLQLPYNQQVMTFESMDWPDVPAI